MKKRVLIVHFSQSGQLNDVVRSIAGPLEACDQLEVSYELLRPEADYPFPWPFFRFFDTFPETVYADPLPIRPLSEACHERYDLVILAYQVWFLSPAQPITAFLNAPETPALLRDTPVITLIACRNMWLMAQETMKERLEAMSARLVDNIVLTDPALSGLTFFSTPMWVLTGNRGPWLGGLIPEAGVSADDIAGASRFGLGKFRTDPIKPMWHETDALARKYSGRKSRRGGAAPGVGPKRQHLRPGLQTRTASYSAASHHPWRQPRRTNRTCRCRDSGGSPGTRRAGRRCASRPGR